MEYDDAWPARFAAEESAIRSALGGRAIAVHHAGSTSVPGLAAKPVVDIVLVVGDPVDEETYVPALEGVGLMLALREPEWFDHRLLRRAVPRVNLHVFGPGCPEVARMLAFRDRLRADEADRTAYERKKRELAARTWERVQDYADAKSEVVADIMRRA